MDQRNTFFARLGSTPAHLFVLAFVSAVAVGCSRDKSGACDGHLLTARQLRVDVHLPPDHSDLTRPFLAWVTGEDLSYVEFLIDDREIVYSNHAPHTWRLNPWTLEPGQHSVAVRVAHRKGVGEIARVVVTVPESYAKRFSFTLPKEGAHLRAPAVVRAGGRDVRRVAVLLDGEVVQELRRRPFSWRLDPRRLPQGAHVLRLDASTNTGETASASVGFLADAARPTGRALEPTRTCRLWSPCAEWSLPNPTFSGNPYDLIARVTFTHLATGEKRRTGMYYAGKGTWKFRFSGTRLGLWTFLTQSSDEDLAAKRGTIMVEPNPGKPGFLTNFGSTWAFQGTNEAFTPQLVMYAGPQWVYRNPERLDKDIRMFLGGHRFSGFHVPVFCRWFDIDEAEADAITVPNPDPRTFAALELLIEKVHAYGGIVHLWAWGDESRRQTPVRWGKNGPEDRRLQRYIAARLGPLPGWTMGYGFDLWEWATERDLREWHRFMHAACGWKHYLGGRAAKNILNQIYEGLDYASYEQHKPSYATYVRTIACRPQKPSFSEDRFRIRGRPKDYDMLGTRRGLWRSTMAGGVANIWGNLRAGGKAANDGTGPSAPYPVPEWIATYSRFFEGRFRTRMKRENDRTNGVCLRDADGSLVLFYGEHTDVMRMGLSDVPGPLHGVAVDCGRRYREIDLGELNSVGCTWRAPYVSDWAIAVTALEKVR